MQKISVEKSPPWDPIRGPPEGALSDPRRWFFPKFHLSGAQKQENKKANRLKISQKIHNFGEFLENDFSAF